MRKNKALYTLITLFLIICLCACSTSDNQEGAVKNETQTAEETKDEIVVGFSQLGAESDWRSENTKSMKETFSAKNGYRLLFNDGQQKQSNQMMAVRKFIQQEVDYIVIAPVTEVGWDNVLLEAREAGIPVIIVDRMVDVKDDSLFTCWVGSDFYLEAKKLTAWLADFLQAKDFPAERVNIVGIQGNMGASAQIGRTRGLEEACEKMGWKLLEEVSGEFTQARGREVMEQLLIEYEDINVVYSENDNMAFGIIEAIEAAGRNVGSDIANGDIMVVSFDGVGAMAKEYVRNGKISCIAECNPLHGPRVESIIDTLRREGTPEKLEYVGENLYSADDTIKSVIVDGKVYPVTHIE